MKKSPIFSVIMPTYNHEEYLEAAISSVLNQTFSDFELVVCNDGSTDGSHDILENYAAKSQGKIRLIHKPNGGTVSALNACLMEARGDYVCWLSSDDLFSPSKLQIHFDYHSGINSGKLSVAQCGVLDSGAFFHIPIKTPQPKYRLTKFVAGNYINGLTVCAKRELYVRYGIFDHRYPVSQDSHRWFNFFRHERPEFLGGEVGSFSRVGSGHVKSYFPGHMDHLRMIYSAILKGGLHCLIPQDFASVPIEEFLDDQVLSDLMSYNIFHQLKLHDYLLNAIGTHALNNGYFATLNDHVTEFLTRVPSDRQYKEHVLMLFDRVISGYSGSPPTAHELISLVQYPTVEDKLAYERYSLNTI
jgi:glycosyltransferase involved in cell wall biosynthesis